MSLADDVLTVLRDHRWKSTVQIHSELEVMQQRIVALRFLYSALDHLLQQKMVERRFGKDPKIIARRGGRQYFEFRLAEGGIRRLDEIETARRAKALGRGLPQPA